MAEVQIKFSHFNHTLQCILTAVIKGSPVVEIAIKTGDKDYAGSDVPMRMKICDQEDNCCLTAENLHHQFGNDRERGSLDVYADSDLLGNCDSVRFHN